MNTPVKPEEVIDADLKDTFSNESNSADPVEPQDAEKLNNIRNTQPAAEDTIGRDTVGQGQPTAQKVNQEESLPPSAVPVEKNFAKTGEFFDPMKSERAIVGKDSANNGAEKTPE